MLICSMPALYLYSLGEYENLDDIVTRQMSSDKSIIYGSGLYGDTFFYKAYLTKLKPAEILIKGSKINIIKKRQKLKDII